MLSRPTVGQCGLAFFRQLVRVPTSQAAASPFFAATEFLDLRPTSLADRPVASSCLARPALILTLGAVDAADQNQHAQNHSSHGPLSQLGPLRYILEHELRKQILTTSALALARPADPALRQLSTG